MKDNRSLIPEGTKIPYSNGGKNIVFTVSGVIGRGGNCIAYNAFYTDNYGIRHDCILKQLHPIYQNCEWNNVNVSGAELERFIKSYTIQKTFGMKTDTLNSTALLYDIFSYKDSVYFQYSEKNFGMPLESIHFDSIHDYIFILLQTAQILKEYHKQGWLHLDIKPQNIFCKTDGNDYSVLMFDFDSMIKTDIIQDPSNIISCSKNYAPPEVIRTQRSKISIASDFYEIGCMLFEKIFCRFPKSSEISGFTKYRFNESILKNCRSPELIYSLQEFFRHTLTVSISSRFSSDDDFINALKSLYSLSEVQEQSIISNFTMPSAFFIGRDNEIRTVRQKLIEKGRIIIDGAGGIGKSSLALKYTDTYKNDYNTIIYLEYHGSFDELIENDIQITGLSPDIPLDEKMDIFRQLCNDRTLVILDNLDNTDYTNLYNDWFSLPCHVIATSRSSKIQYSDITFSLSGLENAKELFCHYYIYPCSEREQAIINDLIYIIDSHTMMTELLGKFCCHYRTAHGTSNFEDVYNAFRQLDTGNLGPDKVKQLKDWTPQNRSVQKHMDTLFFVVSPDDEEKRLLQFFALLNLKAVSDELVQKWYGNHNIDCAEKLYSLGMIQYHDSDYKIHPLIAERVLCNYPPKAESFVFTTEKITDSLLFSDDKNKDILLRIAEDYTAHLYGTDRSVGMLYQAMVLKAPEKQKKLFENKAMEISVSNGEKHIPYFFLLKRTADKFSALSETWFEDEQAEEPSDIIDDFKKLCAEAFSDTEPYRIVQKAVQNAGVCGIMTEQDLIIIGNGNEKSIYEYQVKFLEKALEHCEDNDIIKKIASVLYDCYTDIFSPVENAVKAEKYSRMSYAGIISDDTDRHENSDDEQETASGIIEALRMENQNEECLRLADFWYDRHINEKIPIEHYLCFLMKCLYEENHLWERYFTLVQEEADDYEDKCSLQSGKACYYLKEYKKANEYLLFSERYYSSRYSFVLNSNSENYLLTLGYLSLCNEDLNKNIYETKFFSYSEKFYKNSLIKTSYETAEFCLEMCRKYLVVSDIGKTGRFLKLYARFIDAVLITEEEYAEFNIMLERISETDRKFFWIRILQAGYLENNFCPEDALKIYHDILDNDLYEYYSQLVYSKIESCSREDFLEHFSDKIDYEILFNIERQGEEELPDFDESIGKRLEIVKKYKEINSHRSEDVMKKITEDISNFDGDRSTYIRALEQVEKYFLSAENINSALSFALKKYESSQKELSSEKNSQICSDIAYYYYLKKEYDKEAVWIEKAVSLAEDSKTDNCINTGQIITAHEKILSFYERHNYYEKAIRENRILESIMLSDTEKRFDDKLKKVYNSLRTLFFKTGNLTQSYFYQTLEEQIIQKSFL